MGNENIRLFTVTDSWQLIGPNGTYKNDGDMTVLLQKNVNGAPSPTALGVKVRPGETIFVPHDENGYTYVRTFAGTSTLALYDDNRNITNSVAIITDPDNGNKLSINDEGQAHVVLKGSVDADNSTNDILLADGVFTGSAVNTLDYAIINISVYSDVASATDGLSIQQSCDGINWDISDEYTIPAGTGKTFSIQAACKYYRIVYTNGGSDQTDFRLNCLLKKQMTKPSSHRISDSIISDDDAELVKSVLTGQAPSGTFANVNVTEDGNLTISDNSSGLAISEGNVTGATFVHKFGQAPDFDYGDGVVTVWDGANDAGINQMRYVYSTTAAIDSISSSNATDTQQIQLQGLDENFELVTQQATLNGQTRVSLTTPLIRVFRLKNNGFTDLVGNVCVYENTTISGGIPTDTTKIKAMINNGNNQTLMAVYTIPAGKKGYLRDWYASTSGASKDTSYIIRLYAREYDESTSQYKAFQLKHITSIADGGTTYIQHKYEEPEKFNEKVDIEMRVSLSESGASGAAFSAGFDIVLIDD